MSIASSIYSVASVSSAESEPSGGLNGNGENGINGHAFGRSDAESDVCSVRSFDTGDEGGDEYENEEEMDDDVAPPSSMGKLCPSSTITYVRLINRTENGIEHVSDDGERTPETNAEVIRGGIKRPRRDFFSEGKLQRSLGGHLDVDWEGDMRMRSPRP